MQLQSPYGLEDALACALLVFWCCCQISKSYDTPAEKVVRSTGALSEVMVGVRLLQTGRDGSAGNASVSCIKDHS